MKLTKNIVLICFSLFILSCSGYGEKLQYNKTEVYYTNKVDKADAEKLGDFLISSGFAGENEKSIQLSKDDENGNYQFRMVTTKEAAESETYKAIFEIFATQISDSVFNKKPVDFHICNNIFKTLKVIPFKNDNTN
ncbi:hypothetical protein [Polaribacter porphyrae]|uniref:Uncharacterized protein n=1 Tax=Polaribacter porphyrae TaxID=1137780 RepID=A0A2S7WQT1_9FLAO|nr:hypothetical protein [Polaribacter porphyrae]PQJ79621.1 hypothetical protein BTO18_10750 [Polaribacter porphyrae]